MTLIMTHASPAPTIHWFRDDLRLRDNPALHAAAAGGPVICVHVLDEGGDRRPLGGAVRWWLAQSLRRLSADIAALGGTLLLLRGNPEKLIPALTAATGAGRVVWNRRYDAAEIALDTRLKSALTDNGIDVRSFNGNLLNEPWEVATQAGGPMKVFTPYWRAARARGEPSPPLPAPASLKGPALPGSITAQALHVEALGLEPTTPDWAGGLRAAWVPGEDGARERLIQFLEHALSGYGDNRNRPDMTATSRLSPHLRFGEISPRQIWHTAHQAFHDGDTGAPQADLDKFLSEVGWREFAYHLLFYNPDLATRNYNPRFDSFPWAQSPADLAAWQRGQTGYPIVDAGLRELWHTGWMHNRVRMIVASFLIKHLLIDWREGERWFWDTLVDADCANNPASWQWVAGSGADAAPYFRIFNPISQGEKFDPNGDYVSRWVPELGNLPRPYLFQPWTAPAGMLRAAGITLGQTYPQPIVPHDFARQRALAAFQGLKPVS